MTRQQSAYVFAGLAILFWSTVSTAFKISLRYVSPYQLLFWASLFSLLILSGILTVQGKWKILLSFSKREMASSALLGFLNPFLYYFVLFQAYNLLRTQEAQALNYTWAIVLALLSIPLLHHPVRPRDIIALLLSFVGVLFISIGPDIFTLQFHFENPIGVGLALSTSIIWALFWIFNVRQQQDPLCKLFWNFLFGNIFILIFLLIRQQLVLPPLTGLFATAYVGCFEMGITFVVWLKALTLTENASKITNLIFLTPFISFLFIYFILGEAILLSTVIGLVFIIIGILWQQIPTRRKTCA